MTLVTRERGLVVQEMESAQRLFHWLMLGADLDNDSAFMNDVVVRWCGFKRRGEERRGGGGR